MLFEEPEPEKAEKDLSLRESMWAGIGTNRQAGNKKKNCKTVWEKAGTKSIVIKL